VITIVKVWKARESTIKIDAASDISIDNSAALDTFFNSATAITARVRNITITEPEGAVDKIDLLGVDANNFQNCEWDEKPYGLARITGTILMQEDKPASGDFLEMLAFGSGTSIPTDTPTHQRFQAGDGNREAAAFLVNLDDGTYEVNIVLMNAKIIKLGDRRISSADGFWEQDFEAVCKPKDFYVELKISS